MRNGEIKLGNAERITSLPKQEPRELVAAGTAALKAKAKELRETPPAPTPRPDPAAYVRPKRMEP